MIAVVAAVVQNTAGNSIGNKMLSDIVVVKYKHRHTTVI